MSINVLIFPALLLSPLPSFFFLFFISTISPFFHLAKSPLLYLLYGVCREYLFIVCHGIEFFYEWSVLKTTVSDLWVQTCWWGLFYIVNFLFNRQIQCAQGIYFLSKWSCWYLEMDSSCFWQSRCYCRILFVFLFCLLDSYDSASIFSLD